MTTVTEDLTQWKDRKVIVTINKTDSEGQPTAEEIEGVVENASAIGLLIKPKGKGTVEMVEATDIESIVPVAEKPKPLKSKSVKEIPFGQVRAHLLVSHGAQLSEINNMTEEDALKTHDAIDHADLGHQHDLVPATKSDED